jgi:glycine/D-amino acid oxidase-like deaminating enzyme
MSTESVETLVIGAGLSGLATAVRLHEAGREVHDVAAAAGMQSDQDAPPGFPDRQVGAATHVTMPVSAWLNFIGCAISCRSGGLN